MQKQLGGLLLFSLILLSGCGQQGDIQDALTVQMAIQKSFLYSDIFSVIDSSPFSSSGVIRESLGLYSNTSSDSMASDIDLAITTDNADSNVFSSIIFSGSLEDKEHSDVINGSGSIYYISTGEKQYINRQEGYVDLGPGNTESFIIRMVLDAIQSQWMLIDDNELIHTDLLHSIDGAKIFDILAGIKNIVRQDGLFTPITSSVAGLYPLNLSTSGNIQTHIENLYRTIGKDIGNTEIFFVGSIQTVPKAKIVIEHFYDANDNWSVSGYIGIRNGAIVLKQEDILWTIDWQETRNSVAIQASIQRDQQDPISLSVRITPKAITDAVVGLAFEGEVGFALSSKNILTFPIAGLYGIYIVNETQFLEPTRYILMSQLFGDEYGIARILESE